MERGTTEWVNVVQMLGDLPDARLYELVSEVLERRRVHTTDESGDFNIETTVLAKVEYSKITDQANFPPNVEIVGLPTREEYEMGNAGRQDGCFESGTCESCGTEITSFAKRAVCPICNSEVGLT